jgi:hypothetical protein
MIAQSGRQLLDLLFREGEEICVSHDEFGYHSVPLTHLDYETIELVSPSDKVENKIISTSEIKLVALNPTKGFRRDENVTSFRNFLVEVDDMPLQDQLTYVGVMNLPYSACVFSGNKSLHFAICLEDSLPSYNTYYYYANWILNVMQKADQKTKNPTRSIRFPGAIRNGKEQKLVSLRPRITVAELTAWLSQYEGLKPTGFGDSSEKRALIADRNLMPKQLPGWVMEKVVGGVDKSKGRNLEWFKIGSEFGKVGYYAEDAIEFLDAYFVSEYDFKRSEWIVAIKSGIKNGRKKAGLE